MSVDKLVAVMSGRSTYNVRDEDDMTSDDAFGVPTQQSVKAYADALVVAGSSSTQTLTNKTLDDATCKFADTADTTKDLFVSLGGATTAKTMTIISSQTDDRSLTLPDATDTLVGKATTDTLTNKTLTSSVLNAGVSGTAVLDEDTMSSDSDTKIATQQSIKAYVDTQVVAQNIFLRGEIADISSAASTWVVSPVAGDITGITTVIDGAITVGDAAITFEIGGTPVTGGGITIAYSGSAAGTVDSATPSAANTVTAGQVIEIITDGGSTDAAMAVVTLEITPAAAAPKKVYVTGEIADVSTGASSWVTSPIAGTISNWWSVIDGAIASVDAGLSLEIATVAVTGSAITVAFSGSGAGTVDTAAPTAANTVTAGQAIEVITDGASTNAVKAVVLLEITAA